MRHIVMMRFEDGFFDDAAEQDFQETFAAICQALPQDVRSANVIRNIVDRAQNMTVMVEMQLKDAASLPLYLNHPLHQELGKRYNPHILAIASFDCES